MAPAAGRPGALLGRHRVDRPVPLPATERPHRPAAAALVGRARSTRPRRSTSTHPGDPGTARPRPAPAGLLRAGSTRSRCPARLRAAGLPAVPPQQPAYPQPGYPQPGPPQTGYGAPGTQPYAPPPRQGDGLAKGCLIAAIIGVLVLGAAVVAGIYVFNQASDTISKTFPSGLPTDLPTDFPTDLPTEGLGAVGRRHRRWRLRAAARDHRAGLGARAPQGGVAHRQHHRDEGHARLGRRLPGAVHDVVPRRRRRARSRRSAPRPRARPARRSTSRACRCSATWPTPPGAKVTASL